VIISKCGYNDNTTLRAIARAGMDHVIDIDSSNFDPHPDLDNDDMVVKAGGCTFWNGSRELGVGEFSKIYCKYADYAILDGYNPDVKLVLHGRHHVGQTEHCTFRYIIKEANR